MPILPQMVREFQNEHALRCNRLPRVHLGIRASRMRNWGAIWLFTAACFATSARSDGSTLPTVKLSGLSCSKTAETGAASDTCTVTLGAAAPTGGMVVNLASNSTAVTVPATVTIAAKSSSGSFMARVASVTTAQKVSVVATIPNSASNFTLILQAAIPSVSISSSGLSFGNTIVNTSASKTVTLTSSGNVPVTLNSVTATGAGFTVSGITFPLTLKPGQTANLAIQFDPTALGAVNGQVTVSSNSATAATMAIKVSGTGIPVPSILAGLSCGLASATGTVTTTCTAQVSSAAPSSGMGVTLTSSNQAVVIPSMVKIPANATSASFTAKISAVASKQTATLTATAAQLSRSFAVTLNATVAQLTASSSSMAFGTEPVGTPAPIQSLVLKSTGTAALTIKSATATGAGFILSGPAFPLTLTPGQSVTLNVEFNPASAGVTTGAVTLSSNSASGNTTMVSLSGTGTSPQTTLNGFFCNSSAILGLGSDTCSVVLAGAAPAAGMIVNLTSSNPTVPVPATVVVPGDSTSVEFQVTRTSAGTSPTATLTATLSGTSKTTLLQLLATTPVFSLDGGSYTSALQLQITDTTPGVSIYYTTDGTTPTTSSSLYKSTVSLTSSATVKAIAAGTASMASTAKVANYTIAAATGSIPTGSSFTPPAPDACQSPYDQFYEAEPGVYAYWAMCEAGSNIDIFDYAGNWGLSENYSSGEVTAWGSGNITGGLPGPVPDNETAAQITSTSTYRASVGIPLNANQGTIATWIQVQSTPTAENAIVLYTVLGHSLISLSTQTKDSTCFIGTYVDLNGTSSTAQQCGYTQMTWHRLVMTWGSGTMTLYVDGSQMANATYTGKIDNQVFNYRLFPDCCGYNSSMTLAKALVANQAWSAAQVASDYSPQVITPPVSGISVTALMEGAIHKDVLGYADDNSDLSISAQASALETGLHTAGVTSLRYANGFGGITADLESWQGGASCSLPEGSTQLAQNVATENSIASYLPTIAQPLGVDIGFTVNYGSNPPYCDGGGDPTANGANLVQYANVANNYNIKYWEIGNEQWSAGTEPDFHSNPHTGVSYAGNEPAFYDAMKAVDPSILIAVPIGGSNYNTQTNFDLPVLANAKYDGIVYHNYPIKDPITDGTTLYRDRVSANLLKTRGELLTLQTELLNSGKSPDAIWITEWDANMNGGRGSKQSMGAAMPLFAAGELAEYMRAGVPYATWWGQSSIDVCANSNYDSTGETAYNWWECGDAALVYAGALASYSGQVSVGLQPGDLTPAARAFQVLSQSGFVSEGEHMLGTVADAQTAPWLQGYAATHGSAYAVLLINRDRDSSHTVPVSISGMTSGTSATQWTYGRAQYDLTQQGNWSAGPVVSSYGAWSGTFEATLPPWSINVIVFNR